ncbi:MAG: hypothetical protein JWQ25_897, partial [Daejeonella sp.]|nr:hypothetical protein [Daejeonella sp.]
RPGYIKSRATKAKHGISVYLHVAWIKSLTTDYTIEIAQLML